jgi:hypothetical protein
LAYLLRFMSRRRLRAFPRHRHANPSPSGRLDLPAKGSRSRSSASRANLASILHSKCSGSGPPWSGTLIAELEPTQNSKVKSSSCLVAGQDLNLRPSGYEGDFTQPADGRRYSCFQFFRAVGSNAASTEVHARMHESPLVWTRSGQSLPGTTAPTNGHVVSFGLRLSGVDLNELPEASGMTQGPEPLERIGSMIRLLHDDSRQDGEGCPVDM